MPLSTVTTLKATDEITRQDAEDMSQDVYRMLRRARYWIRQDYAIKRSRPLVRRSAQNLAELLDELMDDEDETTFEACWKALAEHHDRTLEAVAPFVDFFYSHGLLPDEVTEDALVIYVMIQGEKQGLLNFD